MKTANILAAILICAFNVSTAFGGDVLSDSRDGRKLARIDLGKVSRHYEDENSSIYIWDYFSPDSFEGFRKVVVEIDRLAIARESRTFLKLHDANSPAPEGVDPNLSYRYVSLGLIDKDLSASGIKPGFDTNGAAVDDLHDRIALQDNPTGKDSPSRITFTIFDPTSADQYKHLSFEVQSLDNAGHLAWDRGIAAYLKNAPVTGFMFIASGPISGTATVIGFEK